MPIFFEKNVQAWVDSQSDANRIEVAPNPYPSDPTDPKFKESVARGQKLFFEGDRCVTCHKDYGRQSTFRFDEWGTYAKPNNLMLGTYRGGRRPVDIYFRIHSGIQPSGMIPFGDALKATAEEKANKQDKVWDLVNFVRVLGSPAMRKTMSIYLD